MSGLNGKKESKDNKIADKKTKKSGRVKIPKTVKDSIPYINVYEEGGIIETDLGVFSKSYLLKDTNYHIYEAEHQTDIFSKYMAFLNSFDHTMKVQLSVNLKTLDAEDFCSKIYLKHKDDEYAELRQEYNDILMQKIKGGRNNVVKEKYITVSIEASSYEKALLTFQRLDTEIHSNLKRVGESGATPMSLTDRLSILKGLYHPRESGSIEIKDQSGKDATLKNLKKMGITTKDLIGPESISFKPDSIQLGGHYAKVLYIKTLPNFLSDRFMSEFTDMPFNMLYSISLESMQSEAARKMLDNKMMGLDADIYGRQNKLAKANIYLQTLPPAIVREQEALHELYKKITEEDQRLFMATLTVVVFGETPEDINSGVSMLESTAGRFGCKIKTLRFQQERGFNTTLPLCLNELQVKRTLPTEAVSVFIPFDTQELFDEDGCYYGLNSISKNFIMHNRKESQNANCFILGMSGSGKSFYSKAEMLQTFLKSEDDIIVVDPDREYSVLAEMLGGQVIKLAVGSDSHINPFDMSDIPAKDINIVSAKSDAIISFCSTAIGGGFGLTPAQKGIIDRCVRILCEPFINSYNPATNRYDKSKVPTLVDFQNLLKSQPDPDARYLASSLEIYIEGSLNIFAKSTNVEENNRLIVYDLKDIGANLKSLASQVMLDKIWNKLIENFDKRKWTWVYIDEMHLLFKNQESANFMQEFYKRVRKYNGIPTGITQNVGDLLETVEAQKLIGNSNLVIMLNQTPLDLATLTNLFELSDPQASRIKSVDPGKGIISINGNKIPFENEFPKTGRIYWAMNTKPSEIIERRGNEGCN